MAFRLGFNAALPKSRPPKQAASPRLWATHAAVESVRTVNLLSLLFDRVINPPESSLPNHGVRLWDSALGQEAQGSRKPSSRYRRLAAEDEFHSSLGHRLYHRLTGGMPWGVAREPSDRRV